MAPPSTKGEASPKRVGQQAKKQATPRSSREETRTRILDAAEDLFSHRDPNRVTVREIAEKAGVTHPLVHQYVGTKSDILDAVIARGAPTRHKIMEEHPDYLEAMPLLFADVFAKRVNTRSILRSAMDGIEYAPFDDRLKTGQMLLGLARDAVARGTTRSEPVAAVDPRIAISAAIAMAYGWVAAEKWLIPIFDLQEEDPADVQKQLDAVLMLVADLVFEPGQDAGGQEA